MDIKIANVYEVDPAEYTAIKKDGFGNTVYICEAPCPDCQYRKD